MKILVILTCFNRKDKTQKCVQGLAKGNPEYEFTFVVVDDNSTDGTREMLEAMKSEYEIHILRGDGKLFYSGGMRKGMDYALGCMNSDYRYLLMVNDDVLFHSSCIEKMIYQSGQQGGAIIVGTICNREQHMTYGAVKYTRGIHYRKLKPSEWNVPADTFNANAVLIPYMMFRKAGGIDKHYVHSLGDFDYGLSLKRKGYRIYPSREYVGICENNPQEGSWMDASLSRYERIRKKESAKGAPANQWFYFLKKNFGLRAALKGNVTPYIRILIGR